MSGENDSVDLGQTAPATNIASQRLQNRKDKLDEFEKNLGFAPIDNQEDLRDFRITSEEIQKMTQEECVAYAGELSSYALYIQRVINKQRAFLKWCESKINMAVANHLQDFEGYYSPEQRRTLAIVNNEYTKQLEEMRINLQLKVDMLDSIPYQINQVCKALIEAKKRGYGNG